VVFVVADVTDCIASVLAAVADVTASIRGVLVAVAVWSIIGTHAVCLQH
jgi:hypothetical protein